MNLRTRSLIIVALLIVSAIGLLVLFTQGGSRTMAPATDTAAGPKVTSPPGESSPTPTSEAAATAPPDSTPQPATAPPPPAPEDDVPMVRVPAGEFIAGSQYENVAQFQYQFKEWREDSRWPNYPIHYANELPQRTIYLNEFYIDKYEVTNARYQKCVEAGTCASPPFEHYDDPAYGDYPMFWVTWREADAFCRWAGKRLPTELEWEKAARGTDGRWWPWGNEWDKSLYTDREEEIVPAGSFPVDTSPYGAMDMASNVSEWVADWYLPYPGSRYDSEDFGQTFKVIRGGDDRFPGILGLSRRTALRFYTSPDETSRSRGFRCVRGGAAPTPEPTYTPEPTSTPDTAERDMVLIPAGEFLMGSKAGESNERPEHTVYLDAFYIDRCEVSNEQYVDFLNAIGGHYKLCDGYDCAMVREDDPRERQIHIHYADREYVVEPGYEDYPALSVTWYGAKAYCEHHGLRLPTEAEWEKAARGTDGRTWPWGDEWDPGRLGRVGKLEEPAPVCSHPEGASPYGVLNMTGNVDEWVFDWYDEDYYAVSPYRNPQGPASGEERTTRGFGFSSEEAGYYARITRRLGSSMTVSIGFRCAVDADNSK